jgi:curved DNA-binding protein CbpA
LEVFLILLDEVKKSHYETLGVPKTAEGAEIKRAYFGLVREYQPDRFPEEFKRIRAAYETLMDGEKRAEYDAIGDLPASVAPLYHEAQWFDRYGRPGKAAEFYRMILKSHPELDNVREQYALSLAGDGKTGKAAGVWEELCRKHPDNPHYARELGENYSKRGWNRKARAEAERALALDPSSADSWSLLVSCAIADLNDDPNTWEELKALSRRALDEVKTIKAEEWKKVHLYTYAFITAGNKDVDAAQGYLREIIRLVREGGQKGREEGQQALKEILGFVPDEGLGLFYPGLKELADLLPTVRDREALIWLQDIKRNFEIEQLPQKGFHECFRDLFRILISEEEDENGMMEMTAIEYIILSEKSKFDPQLRRLKEEFPEVYALHDSFFNEALRTRDPEKMLHQRAKVVNRFKREIGILDKDPDSPPETIRRAQPKVGRNDPCPCGSGKKYKHCCGA